MKLEIIEPPKHHQDFAHQACKGKQMTTEFEQGVQAPPRGFKI
jgi:hypothetical protein